MAGRQRQQLRLAQQQLRVQALGVVRLDDDRHLGLDGIVEMAEAQVAGVYPPARAGGVGTTFRQWCASVLAPAVA
ncbi:hypothetical protein ABZ436_23685 [Micromonospora matsumotoense]|uniref:hypothetical protein n=1 Tax=Micromonospora matsumotoense TaxID=121616 RepID=UPI003410C2C9